MFIEKITYQHRRDFDCVYKCEHCGATRKGSGYDDDNFHLNVVPKLVCKKCGLKAADTNLALTPKYAADVVI